MSKNLKHGRMIGKKAVAEKIGGVSTKTVDRYVELGIFPPPNKMTGTKFSPCLWYEAEIDEIIRKSTAAAIRQTAERKPVAKTRAGAPLINSDDAAA